MCKSGIVLCGLAVLFFVQPCLGTTDVPDLALSEAFLEQSGPGPFSLLVVPDGSGLPFTGARDEYGSVVDATVTPLLRDSQGIPFILFPREDMWLATLEDGLESCTWGMQADHDTDHNGITQWGNPGLAGGYSRGPIRVFVNGSPLTSNDGLPLWFHSPDLDGDGALDLLDVCEFAQHIGAQCP